MRLNRLHCIVNAEYRFTIRQHDGNRVADIAGHSIGIRRRNIGTAIAAGSTCIPVSLCCDKALTVDKLRKNIPVFSCYVDIIAAGIIQFLQLQNTVNIYLKRKPDNLMNNLLFGEKIKCREITRYRDFSA